AVSGPIQRSALKSLLTDREADGSDKTAAGSSACQGLVLDAMRLHGLIPLAAPVVLHVLLIVALEPDRLRVSLECQDVGGDAIEEPAVVRDDHGATGEVDQRLLECAQGLDIQIVGRLIEQQYVAAGSQHLGQVHAIALSTGEISDRLLLLAALEVEAADVAARGGLVVSDLEHVEPAGDLLPDGLAVIERLA